jgi:hypothetical protein
MSINQLDKDGDELFELNPGDIDLARAMIKLYNDLLPVSPYGNVIRDRDSRRRVLKTPNGDLVMNYIKPYNHKYTGRLDISSPGKFKFSIHLHMEWANLGKDALYIILTDHRELVRRICMITTTKSYEGLDDFLVTARMLV